MKIGIKHIEICSNFYQYIMLMSKYTDLNKREITILIRSKN
jgi:hypothetical protein